MEILKIISVALITACLCLYLRNINSDFFTVTLLCGGTVVLLMTVNYISVALGLFASFFEKTGIDSELFSTVIKVTLVAYLIEFTCGIIDDMGIKSLSEKVSFAGKIILVCMSMPVFSSLFDIIINFLN